MNEKDYWDEILYLSWAMSDQFDGFDRGDLDQEDNWRDEVEVGDIVARPVQAITTPPVFGAQLDMLNILSARVLGKNLRGT